MAADAIRRGQLLPLAVVLVTGSTEQRHALATAWAPHAAAPGREPAVS
ncbi:MAG: hypothetical protein ACLP52_01045 [Streptosporangiaceae bacterium]